MNISKAIGYPSVDSLGDKLNIIKGSPLHIYRETIYEKVLYKKDFLENKKCIKCDDDMER